MKINKLKLSHALEFTGKIIKRSSMIPACACYRLEAKGGKLTAKTSDGDQFAQLETDCEGDLAPVCVPSSSLRPLLQFFKDEVEFLFADGKLKIISGGKFSLGTINADEFPTLENSGSVLQGISAADLLDGIGRVTFASSTDAVITEKFGVHVKSEAKKLVVDAYNGYRYARVEKLVIGAEAEFFIPLNFADALSSALNRTDAVISVSSSILTVKFASGGEYSCKLADVKFLSVDAFLNAEKTHLGEINPSSWLPLFQGASALHAGNKAEACRTSITGAGFEYVGKSGSINLPLPEPLKPCDMNINGETFTPCLSAFKEKLEISVGTNGAIFLKAGELTVVTSQLRNA